MHLRRSEGLSTAHKCVGTGITVTLLLSIGLTVVCLLFATPLMRTFGASSHTLDMAVEYFRIVASFFPFYLLMNVMNSMIRADGSPAYAMIAMIIGAVLNIVLDPIFIFGLKWGIAGAAWATVIGQRHQRHSAGSPHLRSGGHGGHHGADHPLLP